MNQTEKDKNTALQKIEAINCVDGFDPSAFAVDYTDMASGEVRKRLPVMAQLAWFRLKYPNGKITVTVTPGKETYVANARIYPSYQDAPECYLAEASACRGRSESKPSVSPREWAQTAAIGIALRNAGFGLQFGMAGEDFDDIAPDLPEDESKEISPVAEEIPKSEPEPAVPELTPEEKFRQALTLPCPIAKFAGKTLGDVLTLDPRALHWLATKFEGDAEIKAAAVCICEYAASEVA